MHYVLSTTITVVISDNRSELVGNRTEALVGASSCAARPCSTSDASPLVDAPSVFVIHASVFCPLEHSCTEINPSDLIQDRRRI